MKPNCNIKPKRIIQNNAGAMCVVSALPDLILLSIEHKLKSDIGDTVGYRPSIK